MSRGNNEWRLFGVKATDTWWGKALILGALSMVAQGYLTTGTNAQFDRCINKSSNLGEYAARCLVEPWDAAWALISEDSLMSSASPSNDSSSPAGIKIEGDANCQAAVTKALTSLKKYPQNFYPQSQDPGSWSDFVTRYVKWFACSDSETTQLLYDRATMSPIVMLNARDYRYGLSAPNGFTLKEQDLLEVALPHEVCHDKQNRTKGNEYGQSEQAQNECIQIEQVILKEKGVSAQNIASWKDRKYGENRANTENIKVAPLSLPVSEGKIIATFKQKGAQFDNDPAAATNDRTNYGIWIATVDGKTASAVYAPMDGTVLVADNSFDDYGNSFLTIRNESDCDVGLMYLKFNAAVKEGKVVKRGDVLGTMGPRLGSK